MKSFKLIFVIKLIFLVNLSYGELDETGSPVNIKDFHLSATMKLFENGSGVSKKRNY